MKYFLLLVLCSVSISASAQWWRVGPLKGKRFEIIRYYKNFSPTKYPKTEFPLTSIPKTIIADEWQDLNKKEKFVMRNAQHNMRFREYNMASYNFSELALIYIKEGRLSEAKWYLLQSLLITRRLNEQLHTYANLVTLADVKLDMGEVTLARQDMMEARAIAAAKGWSMESRVIEEKIKNIQGISTLAPKADLKYAEATPTTTKSK